MQQAVMGQATDARTAARRALGPVAVGAIAIAVGLEAIGVYADRSGSDQRRTREFLVVLAIIALAGAVVFGWIVPKMLEREALGTPATILSALGLASVLVFWSGLPPILAAGGALLGWAGRDATRGAGLCRVAIALGALALAADVAALVLDMATS